ncbi:MAG TPA: hypothetical protein VFQ40_08790 [Actinomycetota bacterium]|nr:hypothetical protein [Actinomycetota bacterium]
MTGRTDGAVPPPVPPPPPTDPRQGALAGAALYAPAVAFLVPFLGAIVALASPGFGAVSARRAWQRSRATGALAGILVLVILWLPAIAISVPIPLLSAEWHSYRLIPLCGPETTLGWWLPGLAAVLTFAGGVLLSRRLRSPWVWPAGALAATGVYHVAWIVLESMGHGFIC